MIAAELRAADSLFKQSNKSAHRTILDLLRDNESNTITTVAIGPMTNLSLAAAEDIETFLRVNEVVVMGGNIDHTNDRAFQTPVTLNAAPTLHEPPFRLIRQPPGPIQDLLKLRIQMTPVADFNTLADPTVAARVYALTLSNPLATMPVSIKSYSSQDSSVSASLPLLLPSYPDNISRPLHVTLFPMDVTGKHTLVRGELETFLQPLLATSSPLAEWVSAFMTHTFEKVEAANPGTPLDTWRVPVHDVLTIWYCMDHDNPGWEITKDEDLRVETLGQWTKGTFAADRRHDYGRKTVAIANRPKAIGSTTASDHLDKTC